MKDQPRFGFARDEAIAPPHFEGPADEPDRDERLRNQLVAIRTLMLDGRWRTLEQIARATDAPVASVSAQLRHLRKPRFGRYVVTKRHMGDGLYEYHVAPPVTAPGGTEYGG